MPAFAPPRTRVRGNTYDPMEYPYNAVGDGIADDTNAIKACNTAALAANRRVKFIFREDREFLVQDPTLLGTHTTTSDGLIRVPINSGNIVYSGFGAKIKLGPNGAGTAIFRCFGFGCEYEGLDIDLNGTVPSKTKANVAIQISAAGPGGAVADRDGCDNEVRDCYIHGSRFMDTYNTGSITYDHAGHPSGSRAVILTGGTWPANVHLNGAIRINGLWYGVVSRIDNQIILLSTASGANPGSDITSGIPYEWHGEEFKHQGRDGIQVLSGANRNPIRKNKLVDIGWSAIRVTGKQNYIGYNTIINQRGNGIRLAGVDSITIEHCLIESAYCSGRTGILSDAGSSTDTTPLTNFDIRDRSLTLRNNTVRITTDGDLEGSAVALKLGSDHSVVIDGGEYNGGPQTSNVAIKVEDCIRKFQMINGAKCIGVLHQPTIATRGTVTAETSRVSGAFMGASQITVASHSMVAGKSIFLHSSQIGKFNDREFICLEVVNSNNIVIGEIVDEIGTVAPVPYNGGTITDTQFHTGLHELVIEDCIFERDIHDYNQMIQGLISPYATIRRNRFEVTRPKATLVKEGFINLNYSSDLGIKKLIITDNYFIANTDKLTRVIRCTGEDTAGSAANVLLTAGKIICYGNRMVNKNSGVIELTNRFETGDLISSYDDRAIIFDTVGENPDMMYSNNLPTENVLTFTQGQILLKRNPVAGGSPGWVCTTGGKVGSGAVFKAMANLAP